MRTSAAALFLALLAPASVQAQALGPIERLALERAVAAEDPAHAPRWARGEVELGSARIDREGARIGLGRRTITIALASVSRAAAAPVASSDPVIAGPEVRLVRGAGIVEWWRSLPRGLEHGVTIDARPAGIGALRLELALGGARADATSAEEIAIAAPDGTVIARYGELLVLDARDAQVPARLEVRGAAIAIVVDDRAASYPLRIDPMLVGVEEATLVASPRWTNDFFGSAIAISAGADRAVVGVPQEGIGTFGRAQVFVRTGTSWALEGTLEAPDGAAGDHAGNAVAITADGSRAVVGAMEDDGGGTGTGSANVFVRTGSTWAHEAQLLSPTRTAGDAFGTSVAISDDGAHVIVGEPLEDRGRTTNAGVAHAFARSGSTWAHEAVLAPATAVGNARNGGAVAMSGDGLRAIVGSRYESRARVYLRTGSSWAEESELRNAAGDGGFGEAVAMDETGTRALVGASGATTAAGDRTGSAHVMIRTGTAWTEEAVLLGFHPAVDGLFGEQLGLARDGAAAIVRSRQSAVVFTRGTSGWGLVAVLYATDRSPIFDGHDYAAAMAISEGGARALVGDTHHSTSVFQHHLGIVRVYGFGPAAADGAACTDDAGCVSGWCSDGVCCESRCGAGTIDDCQACSAARTGATSGLCRPVRAGSVVCRSAQSAVCDVAESCDGVSIDCPADAFVATTAVCRPSGGDCDVEDRCTGTGPACDDALQPSGFECRASIAACDPAETCSGFSRTCRADVIACDDAGLVDAGVSGEDAGAIEADASATEEDAGAIEVDAGAIEVDAGAIEADAGVHEIDAGTIDDAGVIGADTAVPVADAAPARDAGADAGVPTTSGGCGCRAGGRSEGAGLIALSGLALALAAHRRRRR